MKARSKHLSPGLQDLLVLACGLTIFASQLGEFADDPGVGWHLKSGAWIAAHGRVPHTDPFLFSAAERPWICDQWLSDLGLHWLYSAGGWPLLYALLPLALLCAILIVLYRAVARASGSWVAASVSTLAALKVAQLHLILRPVVFSLVLFALLYALLVCLHGRVRAGERPGLREHLALFCLFLLWANLHPAFVLGLALVALLCLSCLASRGVWLITLPLAALGATLLNPSGIELHESVLSLGRSGYFMRLNAEWLPPAPASLEGALSLAMLAGSLPALLTGRLSLFEAAALALFGWLGSGAVRLLPFYALAACLPFAKGLRAAAEALADVPGLGATRTALTRLEAEETECARGLLGFALLLIITLANPLAVRDRLLGGRLGPSSARYPFGAIASLRTEAKSRNPAIVASIPDWGGFISFFPGPDIMALIDDRNTLLGEDLYKRHFESMRSAAEWLELVRGFGATHALLPRRSALAEELRERMALEAIYEDDVSILFRFGEPGRVG